MREKIINVLLACLIVSPAAVYQAAKPTGAEQQPIKVEIVKEKVKGEWQPETWQMIDPTDSIYVEEIAEKPKKKLEKKTYTEAELELLANVVTAESLNQGEHGWALVCDVILNRVKDKDFPNTIECVIYQKNQFTCTFDGGTERWPATDEVREVCRKELENGSSYPGLFYYTAGRYSNYGTPAFAYKDHYFSTK